MNSSERMREKSERGSGEEEKCFSQIAVAEAPPSQTLSPLVDAQGARTTAMQALRRL